MYQRSYATHSILREMWGFQVLTWKYIVLLKGHAIHLYPKRTFCFLFAQSSDKGKRRCGIWAPVDTGESPRLPECIWSCLSLKRWTWRAAAPRGPALTLHGLEGFEVLATEQRLGQLADEQLQQAGCVVLLDTFPVKSPFVKLCFQFLAKILKGRRKKKKKKKTLATNKRIPLLLQRVWCTAHFASDSTP